MSQDIQPTNGAAVERKKPTNLAEYFSRELAPQLAAALPKHLTPDRMARVCLTALRTTRDLALCTPLSFAGEIMKLAQLGLEPNTPLGHAWLIPRRNHGVMECTTIIGYQGYLELARRSGAVRTIYAHAVFDGDLFEYELGLHQKLRHVPAEKSDTITHAYCVAHLDGAEPLFKVLSLGRIEQRRKRGASGNGKRTPWDDNFEAMALKSAVRALWPWLPKSAEMALAAEMDDDGRPSIATLAAQHSAAASTIDELNAALTQPTSTIDLPADPEPGAGDEP